MYHQYFGLTESPFSISVNPRYLFMSPRHRDALAHLLYGVGNGGGFVLLTGEVGTGKTTINRCLIEQLPDTTDLAIVLNPALSAVELLATVCDEFAIKYSRRKVSLKILTDALHTFLLDNHAAARQSVLMIDEAQHLDFDVLEQIRLLTNLETDDEKLLQIILIGQPELTEKLGRPELRQLNQRITARYDLGPLSGAETGSYIRHRLEVAGLRGADGLFPASVVREIHRLSAGIPRQINLLCDRSLLGAYGRQQARLTPALVRSAAIEVFGGQVHGVNSRRWIVALAVVVVTSAIVAAGVWIAEPAGLVASTAPDGTASPNALDGPATSSVSTAVSPAMVPIATAPVRTEGEVPGSLFPLSPEQSALWLWQLSSDAPQPPLPCSPAHSATLRCEQAQAQVWEPLMTLNRPVALTMQTADKFTAETLVVSFESRSARVLTAEGVARVPLVDLARHWMGGYRYFWQAPEAWQGALRVGDSAPIITVVANRFAALDQQASSLADELFTEALAQRIRLFQAEEKLLINGLLDRPTLMRLQEGRRNSLSKDELLNRAESLVEAR